MTLQRIPFDLKKIHEFWNNSTGIHIVVICTFIFLNSCIDESFESKAEGAFINISLANNVTAESRGLIIPDEQPEKNGEGLDNIVKTLRILVFDENDNLVNDPDSPDTGNKLYAIFNTSMDIVQHPVRIGKTYTMVFLANEPSDTYFTNISTLSDFKEKTAYPADAFNSNDPIPMMQVIEDVEVLTSGKVKLGEGTLTDINGNTRAKKPEEGLYEANTETGTLILRLDRLAVRINVLLQSEYDIDTYFEGITLSKLPTKVPLFQGYYTIDDIVYTEEYPYDADEFTSTTKAGMVWATELKRIVIPSLHLNDKEKAATFTLRLGSNMYSPSTELRSPRTGDENNYSLPYNAWLDFEGTVKEVLEVNIKADDWTSRQYEWTVPENRTLDVSHTEVSITDFNGARISFKSNMPVVRVLSNVVKIDDTGDFTAGEYETNRIFNSIVPQETHIIAPQEDPDLITAPARFLYVYDKGYGTGYMDLLADGWVNGWVGGSNDFSPNLTGTYKLTLSAENTDGTNALQREITVSITQNGVRTLWYDPINHLSGGSRAFVGAFWKNNEKGERIIAGQNIVTNSIIAEWSAQVQGDATNWVILSSTPSFDPNVGTDNPGDPEKYPVVANEQKANEDGSIVYGKGRIYFRIGLKDENPNDVENGLKEPRYGIIKVDYHLWGGYNPVSTLIYVRQGEDPDYLYEHSSAKARFSVYNVTHIDFKTSPSTMSAFSYRVDESSVGNPMQTNGHYTAHVDYPTQGGAHFQWARVKDNGEFPYGSYEPDTGPTGYVPTNRTAYKNFGYRALNPNPNLNAIDASGSTFYSEGWGWGVYNSGQLPSNKDAWNNYLIWNNGNPTDSYTTEHEICPNGYRRAYDGPYTGGDIPPRHKTIGDAETSEWRASIFAVPIVGDGNANFNNSGYDNEFGVIYYQPKPLPGNMLFGLYADGYFDRLPLELKDAGGAQYGVRIGRTDAAYWGTVAINGNKSLFFPAAGLRNYGTEWYGPNKGIFQYPDMGYYMTASPADTPEKIPEDGSKYWPDYSNVWTMQINYVLPAPVGDSFKNGYSLRCVKNNP